MIEMVELVARVAKTVVVTLAGGLVAIWAQAELPGLDAVGNVGLVGLLALLVARYTFRQLEDYRSDLKAQRERNDELESDLHELGKAKAECERLRREAEDYAQRLRLHLLSGGASLDELPSPPLHML